jgi:hypothetical protein
MSLYRYYITGRINAEIYPTNNKLRYNYSQEKDERLGYETKASGSFTLLSGKGYEQLLRLEKSAYRCEGVGLKIKKQCGSTLVDYKECLIYLNSCNFDLDKCMVEVTVENLDAYTCIEKQGSKKNNIFNLAGNVVSTPFSGVLEYATCFNNDPCAAATGDGWQLYGQTTEFSQFPPTSSTTITNFSYYVRVRNPDNTYRPALLGAIRDISNGPALRGFIRDVYPTNTSIDNGKRLGDVLQLFLQTACNNYTVVSDFFQINPANPSTINYVTGQKTKTANLVIYQKSDVKRPSNINAGSFSAKSGELSLEELLKALQTYYNVGYFLQGNTFRIEHVSYSKVVGLFDLLQPRYNFFTKNTKKYSYDNSKTTPQEVYRSMETGQRDFEGLPITYNNACTEVASEKEKIYDSKLFTTDVEMCLRNPQPDSEVVKDSGFVLIALDENDVIISEASVLPNARIQLNNSLAFAQLHRDYWRHGRPFKSGILNGNQTNFITYKNKKKLNAISVPICCEDAFSPEMKISTPLGLGVVDEATEDLNTGFLELDVLLNDEDGLYVNQPPVANTDTVFILQDTTVIVDALANDTDADGTIVKESLIVMQTNNCVATVTNDFKIQIVPTAGFVGTALAYYMVKDTWGEPSNLGVVDVRVIGANQIPIAVNDIYIANIGAALTVAASAGLLINDADDQGQSNLSVIPASGTTAQGGSYSINADGGFTYVPPSNSFIGSDTFNYTVKDAQNNQDTAIVTIVVKDPNTPTANPDYYRFSRKKLPSESAFYQVFANRGLLVNDTDDTSGLTVVAENKNTNHGEVQINADGSFGYKENFDYIGLDTFTYQLKDANNNIELGTVTMRVNPRVFVKLFIENLTLETLSGNCGAGGGVTVVGRINRGDVIARFYSDAETTVLQDMTGRDTPLVWNTQTSNSSTPTTATTAAVVGNSIILATQASLSVRVWGCGGSEQNTPTITTSFSIVLTDDYIIRT